MSHGTVCLRCRKFIGEPTEPVGLPKLGEGLCRCVHPIASEDGVRSVAGLTLAQHNRQSLRHHVREVAAERVAS